MKASVGRNTANGERLLSFVERIERYREQKKELSDAEKAAMAEAKAEGFTPKRIGDVLKIRAMNPKDREEAEAELDMYLHAIGMSSEAPLFRAVGLMGVDTAAREQVIDAMKLLVPQNGEFILKIGGSPVRIWRDKEGATFAEDFVETKPKAESKSSGNGWRSTQAPPPPDVSEQGAEALGKEAYRTGTPIIKNPFPWGDARRPLWDRGWRTESGGDGMGPSGGDD